MPGLLSKIFGDSNEREINKLRPIVQKVNSLEEEYRALSEAQLSAKTDEFKARLAQGEGMEDILPEAFAAVREASRRTIGLRHFDVQLMGGVVLHQGKIAEMKTGEGKTLVATLPLYLNALAGQGAHLVTVNDYLAKRDTQWMGPIYHSLGLSVGVIQHESSFIYDPSYPATDERLVNLRPCPRREAYLADIIYGTNNEFGFDYLRDNMVWDLSQCVQRKLYYAIVDEVDNILIDEARTPLIISGPAEESADNYNLFARLVPRLQKETDYKIDEKLRVVALTEEGIAKMERWLNLPNLYDPQYFELTHYLEEALKAQFLYRRDRDYVVKDGQVIIVDEFTGRLMFGRRYSEGLHQAIEAKETVKIQRESQTLATITFQNYFRMYQKLAGMTGTAQTEAEEFFKIYKLDVVVIPTNMPMIREDYADQVYKTEEAKFRAVVREIQELHQAGRPVLVGTVSIEKSEHLSHLLDRIGVPHQVLNAKYHEKEAGIIAQAGRPGQVTIATNMAGRGVDIILGGNPERLAHDLLLKRGVDPLAATPEDHDAALGEAGQQCRENRDKVVGLDGLHILGTERHEARRIDNQLRGRAGRQGDPGSSRFYVSLEDDLMRRFGGQGIANIMERFGLDEDIPIEHSLVSKSIENAQVKVEGYNFDIRKHVVEYDDVMNKQREVIYGERKKILSGADLKSNILQMVKDEVQGHITAYAAGNYSEEWDLPGLVAALRPILPTVPSAYELQKLSKAELESRLMEAVESEYEKKERALGPEIMRQVERLVMLQVIDGLWVHHLTALDDLREGIGLRAYGQKDPLVEFKNEAYEMFQGLLSAIQHEIVHRIYWVTLVREPERRAPQMATNRAEGGVREPVRALGDAKPSKKSLCPCGSGRRFEDCHGRRKKEARPVAVPATATGTGHKKTKHKHRR